MSRLSPAGRAGRLPAGVKLLGLAVVGCLVLVTRSIPFLAAMAVLSTVVALSRIGPRRLFETAGPGIGLSILLVVVATGLFEGSEAGLVVLLRLVTLLVLALLLTATTRAADIQEALVAGLRPLERLPFVAADKVALALALALRALPRIRAAADEIREAQAARGLALGPMRLAVPLAVRILRDAETVADAIDSRCWPPATQEDRHDHP